MRSKCIRTSKSSIIRNFSLSRNRQTEREISMGWKKGDFVAKSEHSSNIKFDEANQVQCDTFELMHCLATAHGRIYIE